KARRMGLVDEVFPAQGFRERVAQFAKGVAEGATPKHAERGLLAKVLEATPPGRAIIIAAARKQVRAKTGGGYPAPFKILDVVQHGLGHSLESSLALESEAAGELIAGDVSKNLIHV